MTTEPTLLPRADAYLDAGQYGQALSLAGRHLAEFPDDVDALLIVARAQSGLGLHQESFSTAQRAVALAPDHPGPWIQLALSAPGAGQVQAAIDAAWRAVQLNPGHWSANLVFAHVATMHGERVFKGEQLRRLRADAFQHAEVARSQAPDNPAVHVVMGYCLADLKRFDEARLSFQQALRLDPDNTDAKGGLGYLDLNSGDAAAAAAASAGVLRDDPTYAAAEHNLNVSVVKAMRWVVFVGMGTYFAIIRSIRYLADVEPPLLVNLIIGTIAVAASIWFVFFVRRFLKRAGGAVTTFVRRNRLVVGWAACFTAVLVGLLITACVPVPQMQGVFGLLVLPPYLAAAVLWIIITRRLKKRYRALQG